MEHLTELQASILACGKPAMQMVGAHPACLLALRPKKLSPWGYIWYPFICPVVYSEDVDR